MVEGALEGRLESVALTAIGGRSWFSLPPGLADLNQQAKGRRRRKMDQVLENKVTVKETFVNSGRGMLAVSAALMIVGNSDVCLAVVLYPTAAATALLGGGALLSGEAVVTEADTRIWACLSGRLLVIPVSGVQGALQVTGYMGWDEVYKGEIDIAAPRRDAINVCHKSLLPERLAIHANWRRQVLDSVDDLINAMKILENEKRMEFK